MFLDLFMYVLSLFFPLSSRLRFSFSPEIRHVSDEHVPSLSPSIGQWKIGTVHRARVTGFHALDGILQLSMQQSVLEQKFLQVQDVTVGEVLKVVVLPSSKFPSANPFLSRQ